MTDRYILDDEGQPVPCPDLRKWAEWMKRSSRIVDQIEVTPGVQVSTVFLGLDHSFGAGPPLLYETMIFGGYHDQYQYRYPTREEAVKGHQKAVTLVKGTGYDHRT